MKNTLLFTTVLAGLALMGCNKTNTRTATADTTPPPAPDTASTASSATTTPRTSSDTLGAKLDRAGDRVADATRSATDSVRGASHDAAASLSAAGHDLSARMTEWRLSKTDIDPDVMAGKPVVRTRSDVIATTTGKVDDDTLEKAIKGRLQADTMLSNLKFDVNANKKGEVELEGKAATTEQIAEAMAIAMDNDGVTKVTSKIKLDPNAGMHR